MSFVPSKPARTEAFPEPTWEVAHLFPAQGTWSEEEYLALDTNHLVEFSHGYLEVLPMATTTHQLIVLFLYKALDAFVGARRLGLVLAASLPVRLWPGKYREPDVVYLSAEHEDRIGEEYWEGADLVMEIVSKGGRRRDLEIKRREYATAGIPEYWIIDPRRATITVLRLEGDKYVVHGEFKKGAQASSVLLNGFIVDVTAVFSVRPKKGQRSQGRKKR